MQPAWCEVEMVLGSGVAKCTGWVLRKLRISLILLYYTNSVSAFSRSETSTTPLDQLVKSNIRDFSNISIVIKYKGCQPAAPRSIYTICRSQQFALILSWISKRLRHLKLKTFSRSSQPSIIKRDSPETITVQKNSVTPCKINISVMNLGYLNHSSKERWSLVTAQTALPSQKNMPKPSKSNSEACFLSTSDTDPLGDLNSESASNGSAQGYVRLVAQ